jgi:hypothetical protein
MRNPLVVLFVGIAIVGIVGRTARRRCRIDEISRGQAE